jgi:hypothetical protein
LLNQMVEANFNGGSISASGQQGFVVGLGLVAQGDTAPSGELNMIAADGQNHRGCHGDCSVETMSMMPYRIGQPVRLTQIDKVNHLLLSFRRQVLHFCDRSLDQTHFNPLLLHLIGVDP